MSNSGCNVYRIIGKREQRGTWRTQLKGVLKYIQMSGPVEHTCLVYNHMCSLCIRMFKRQCLSSFLVLKLSTTSAKSHTHHLFFLKKKRVKPKPTKDTDLILGWEVQSTTSLLSGFIRTYPQPW